jgi:hypothetical protein
VRNMQISLMNWLYKHKRSYDWYPS